jgi:Tfp pilus assembly protein FimT
LNEKLRANVRSRSNKRTRVQNSITDVGFPAVYNNSVSIAVHNDVLSFLPYLMEHNKISFVLSTSLTLPNKSDTSAPCCFVQSVRLHVNQSRVH